MNSCPCALDAFNCEEYKNRDKEGDERDRKSSEGDQIDKWAKVDVRIVQTISVVGPRSVIELQFKQQLKQLKAKS